jgi:hypothetical protein
MLSVAWSAVRGSGDGRLLLRSATKVSGPRLRHKVWLRGKGVRADGSALRS